VLECGAGTKQKQVLVGLLLDFPPSAKAFVDDVLDSATLHVWTDFD